MAARDHFRAHARRRVEFAATLRIHEAEAPAMPLWPMDKSAKAGPRLTLEWTGKVDFGPAPEGPVKAEPRAAIEGPAKAEPQPSLEEHQASRGEGYLVQGVRIRDLGLGGAGVEIPDAPGREAAPLLVDRGAPVTIEVLAPTLWDPLLLSGTIAWVRRASPGRGTRAGVRFEHQEPAALYMLFRLLGMQG
jgi:hypothetical protein